MLTGFSISLLLLCFEAVGAQEKAGYPFKAFLRIPSYKRQLSNSEMVKGNIVGVTLAIHY